MQYEIIAVDTRNGVWTNITADVLEEYDLELLENLAQPHPGELMQMVEWTCLHQHTVDWLFFYEADTRMTYDHGNGVRYIIRPHIPAE